jgi:hypothetical protein
MYGNETSYTMSPTSQIQHHPPLRIELENVHQNKMLNMYSKVPNGVTMHWYVVQV